MAGISRKLVAVGTSSDASMFLTMSAPTPLIGSPTSSPAAAGSFLDSSICGAAGVLLLAACIEAGVLVSTVISGVGAVSPEKADCHSDGTDLGLPK